MDCKYFGKCGSCSLWQYNYKEQLKSKLRIQKERFKKFYIHHFDIIESNDGAFRNRAEFRIYKIYDKENNFKLSYAMNDIDKKLLPIDSCSIVVDDISNLMPALLLELKQISTLNEKFFSIEFLVSTTSDMLVTLIYHKKLDEIWSQEATKLQEKFNIKIIGRSRKQKVVLIKDTIEETLQIDDKKFYFEYKEGGFTQPNQKVNIQMIQWVLKNIDAYDDLCELYCGGGNFTIPLSTKFDKVIATEISKTSIKSAKINCKLNNISNISFIRMSSEEFVEALNKKREFRRLQQENINLDNYNFSTIFVDPPRAGLDTTTQELCKQFNQIIYISCNPETLYRDLEVLTQTHTIQHFAFFDQFAYSSHIESGVILTKQ